MEYPVKTTHDIVSFSSNWWDSFLEESESLSRTNVIPDVFSGEEVASMNQEVMKTLQLIFSKKTSQYGFRVYIDGKEQANDFISTLFEQPPFDGENVTDYTNRIFPNLKFGIVINRIEKFSNHFAKRLLLMVQPLFDKTGIPLGGISADIFIGNYGWTPFGIHRDRKGERITHFHLGPGSKAMYTWEDEEYAKLANGKQGNKNIEPILMYARKYEFKLGDMYYMPSGKWHIGFSDQLSVALVLDYLNPTKQAFMSSIFNSLAVQYLKEDNHVLNPEKDLTTDDTFANITSVIALDEKLYSHPFEYLMKHLYKEYKYAIISNGGWSNLTLSLSAEMKYDVDDFIGLQNTRVITPFPFKTYCERCEEELVVYTRGYKIKIKYHLALHSILDKLNTNQEQPVNDLLATLSADWPVEAGLYFLSMLYDKRAIEIVN
jgi:Cupin superfamily protein